MAAAQKYELDPTGNFNNEEIPRTKTLRFANTTKTPTLSNNTSNVRLTTIIAANIRHGDNKIPLKKVLVDTG